MPGDRERTVANDGVRLHVREWPGGGDDVLLIHGLASSSHIWDLVAPRLVRLGLHPVAYDQRGHGRSSKPSSGYGFDRDHGRRGRGDPRDAAGSTDRRRTLVGSERRARARGPPVSRGRRDGVARRRLRHDARPVRLDDREADARTTRVRRDHGRRVPPARPPQPRAHDPRHTRARRGLPVARPRGPEAGGSGHVCRARTTSRSSAHCGNRTRSGCSNASACRRWSWPRVRVRAGRPRRGSNGTRRSPRGGSGRSDPRCRSSGSRGSTTFPCSVRRRSPDGSRGSPRPPPAFGAGARRMVGWRCSC